MSNDGNLHKGHRQRLMKKYLENGIQSLEEHELLEILLFFAFSRCNTNELSHTLINKFGSVYNVLNSPVDELTKINGIGESSAVLLRFLGDFCDNLKTFSDTPVKLDNVNKMIEFCKECFANEPRENCHFLMLDNRNYLLATFTMTDCNFSTVNIDMKSVMMKALNVNAKGIILVHNHPNGASMASTNDVKNTRVFAESLAPLEIQLCDHIIIGNDGIFSMRRSMLIKDIWG